MVRRKPLSVQPLSPASAPSANTVVEPAEMTSSSNSKPRPWTAPSVQYRNWSLIVLPAYGVRSAVTGTQAGLPEASSQCFGEPEMPSMPSPKFCPFSLPASDTLVWTFVYVAPPSVETRRYA